VVKGIMKNLLSSVDLSRKDIDELFKICGMVVSGKRRLSVKKN
jgi:hypothetical protein